MLKHRWLTTEGFLPMKPSTWDNGAERGMLRVARMNCRRMVPRVDVGGKGGPDARYMSGGRMAPKRDVDMARNSWKGSSGRRPW
jgi:hypothetical protein